MIETVIKQGLGQIKNILNVINNNISIGTHLGGPEMVSHADASIPMPANVNGRVVPLRGARCFATINFGQHAVAVTVVAHHIV